MATEKLIIVLDSETDRLDKSLKNTEKNLDNIEGSTKKADESFANFKQTAASAAVAITAVAAAIGVAINQAAEFAKEVKIAAARTGESVERMQALAFATNTVGISMEKLGDIGKDTNEKIGEFLTTGGGGFQDFADVIGLSAIEAREAAVEFEKLSGPDVLQEMVNRMEAAGVSTERMSFALEGMASDTTDLLPLLVDGGKKLNGLTSEFNDLGAVINETDLNKITDVGQALSKATSVFSAQGKQLIADYSEQLIAGIDAVLLFAQKSTATFNIVTTGLGNLLAISQAGFTDFINGTDTLDAVIAERAALSREAINGLLGDDFFEIGKEKGEEIAAGLSEGITGSSENDDDPDKESPIDVKLQKELEALIDSLKTQEELLADKLARDKELLDAAVPDLEERKALLLEIEQRFSEEIAAIEQERVDKKQAIIDKAEKAAAKEKAKQDKAAGKLKDSLNKAEEKGKEELIGNAKILNQTLFDDNKAIGAGIIVAETAQNVVTSVKNSGGIPWGLPSGVAAAAMGLAQLANLKGAGKGGGSISAGGGGGSTVVIPGSDEEIETSTLELTERSELGQQNITITFVAADGDEVLEAIANGLNNRDRRT